MSTLTGCLQVFLSSSPSHKRLLCADKESAVDKFGRRNMADFVIAQVVEKLRNLIVEYAEEQREMKRLATKLKEDLDSIQTLLGAAFSAGKKADEAIENWAEEVSNLAYDAEDVVDELEMQRGSVWKSEILPVIYSYFPVLAPFLLRRLAGITGRTNDMKLRMKKLFDCKVAVKSDRSTWADGGGCFEIGGKDLVIGMEYKVKEIVEHLIQARDDVISVVAIVGIGGIGKTTLARIVYDRMETKFDRCIWLTAPTFGKHVLLDILQQLYGGSRLLVSGGEEGSLDDQLVKVVSSCLRGKRILLVLDDVWDEACGWENVEHVLPIGSRIILTTRNESLAKKVSGCKYVYRLQGLSEADALSLFWAKVVKEDTGDYKDLKSIGEKIVKKCGGLPLAITTMGGLVSTKKAESKEWKAVLKQFDFSSEDSIYGVLSTAYADLPPSLKACFLYCSMFPEDCDIPVKKLVRLWMAEGFIFFQKSSQDDGSYALHQLLRRNLMQIARVGTDGKIRACRMLRIVRDFAMHTSSRYNFCSFPSVAFPSNSRRLSLAWPNKTDTNLLSSEKLRTLLVLGKTNDLQHLPSSFSTMKHLRVLELSGVSSLKNFPSNFETHVHLRYLGLRDTDVKKLSSCPSNLQTLDLRGTKLIELPTSIAKLVNLRYLMLGSSYMDRVASIPDCIQLSSLINLRTLSGVKFTATVAESLGTLTQLRKLSGGQLKEEFSTSLCGSINELTLLNSLVVKCDYGERFNLEKLRNYTSISKLRLGGQLEKFDRVINMSSLTHLWLWDSLLMLDPLQLLGSLPNLVQLSLCNAFNGHSMRCHSGGFPKLKKLSIVRFRHLETWEKLECGAMQSLTELFISHCPKLRNLPEGLADLDSLQVLKVSDINFVFEEKHKFKIVHIPQFLN